jgi:hypothetical protein
MDSRPDREPALPPLTIDVSDDIDPELWAPLPRRDRLTVGGRTIWLGTHTGEVVVVAQPNRWGVVEREFPDAPCLVEADPQVTGLLPLPGDVRGFVDRTHRPIPPPKATDVGRRLLAGAARLGKMLQQIKGVTIAATPFARTVPIITPREPIDLVAACRERGVKGLRPLGSVAGGVAITVKPEHDRIALERIVEVLEQAARR